MNNMFKSGTKIQSHGNSSMAVPEPGEYTIKFMLMTSGYTMVILKEIPEWMYHSTAFDLPDAGQPFYAVKTTLGGFCLSDIKYLYDLVKPETVLDFKEYQSEEDARDYLYTCAVCGREISDNENPGHISDLKSDFVYLLVCPECCSKCPQIKVSYHEKLTYHNVDIDWWYELSQYGGVIGQPELRDDIAGEMEAKCDCCVHNEDFEYCPGCIYYDLDDYMAKVHTELFSTLKTWVMIRLRWQYPDPEE